MKFEKLLIECSNKFEISRTENVLKSIGYTPYESDKDDRNLFIHVYDDGEYQILSFGGAHQGSEKYSYEQFIEKYENKMIKKIHQAKKELGLNNSELSLKMGKSRPYVAKMLNQPQSEKVQNKVIKEIDELLGFDRLCKAKEYAKVMSGKTEITIENNSKEVEISDLKKIIESKDLAISGLIKQNDEAKKIHDRDTESLKLSHSEIFNLKDSVEEKGALVDELTDALNWEQRQHKNNVNNLKSKIKRERIIILIVIAILTALFFLKGSIGG
ncbi:putative transcriptional regulator [Acinetobacter phage vB_ApiM_IME-Ap7]